MPSGQERGYHLKRDERAHFEIRVDISEVIFVLFVIATIVLFKVYL